MADDDIKHAGETGDTTRSRASNFTHTIEVQFQNGTRVKLDSLHGATCAFMSEEDAFSVDDLNAFLLDQGCSSAERVFDESSEDTPGTEHLALMDVVDAPDLSGFYVLQFPEESNVHEIAEQLRSYPGVKHAAALPFTTFASAQRPPIRDTLLRPVRDGSRDHQWYIEHCRIDKAWELNYRGKGVVIAALDSGFETDHPDLIGRFNPDRSFNTATNNNVLSINGSNLKHGTKVVGQVGAAADEKGLVGIAHDAELWLIEVGPALILEPYPHLNPLAWAKALNQVIKFIQTEPRKVVVIIEGQTVGGGNITQISMIREAVLSAIAHGAIVCVAAGNGDREVSEADGDDSLAQGELFKPAGIIVGATDIQDRPFKIEETGQGTNFGEAVTVSAPGDPQRDLTCSHDLDSSFPFTSLFGGTSGATAKVAGAVALMLEANKKLTQADVEQIFRNTGEPITSKPLGRLLNCEQAVLMAVKMTVAHETVAAD